MDSVAAGLASAGLKPGDRVAICLPDGIDMASVLLGVSAVAASAPLNPAYSEREFDFYLADLEAKALLIPRGSGGAARRSAEKLGLAVLELEGEGPSRIAVTPADGNDASEPGGSLHPASSGDVALLLHTSGTTSRPKLVPLTHGNLCRSASNVARALALTPEDRCLNVMPLFHIHGIVAGVLSSLGAGGSVACTPGFIAPRFLDWLAELQPTWYTAVPTMHQAILGRLATTEERPRHRLRLIRSSSAALAPRLLTELEMAFGVPVLESYGMTEAAHQMASNPLPPLPRKPGSVGLPAGPEVEVRGEDGQRPGAGGPGEVVIRGENVTGGYVANPKANTESFLDGGWFRTGDQGYFDEDGYLFLTGRLKEIVNRGGEKISPREIDEVLLDHPAVGSAVAFGFPHPQLGEDLAAAVVPREGAAVTERELREFAASRLAAFKVPRRILVVDAIPKGPTGKLQRIGLAEKLGVTAEKSSAATAPAVAPRNPAEESLASIWREVLRVPRVGVHDDFFDLGGDSVLAAQVVSRVRAAFAVELSPIALFETPTVGGMAEAIASRDRAATGPSVARIPRNGSLPVSFTQRRIWLVSLMEGGALYNRPVALDLTGPLDAEALRRSLEAIVHRHEVLHCSFQEVDGEPQALVSAPGRVELEIEQTADPTDEAAERAIRREVARTFDLARGPLFHARLLRRSPERHVLLFTAHHAVFDDWSSDVFRRELAALYEAFRSGHPASLPELPIQYADFASWQRSMVEAGALESSFAYWRRQLAEPFPTLRLPADRRPLQPAEFRGASLRATLPDDLVGAVRNAARRERVTPFMVLLAAFQLLLHRHTGQTDIAVASPVAGRDLLETEPLIGCFINTLVLRTDLAGDPSFRELLRRVSGVALGAYAHARLPFDLVAAEVRPDRGGLRTPFTPVLFQLRHESEVPAAAAGVRIAEVPLSRETAKFEWTLEIEERDGRLECLWSYDVQLFERETIERLSAHYERLLREALADLERPVSRIHLVSPVEAEALAADFSAPLEEL
jgi:acyl-CoA synthetase (AMP-forming)/AMP-acid ligase II